MAAPYAELTNEEAILNFIFNRSFIGAAPPPAPPPAQREVSAASATAAAQEAQAVALAEGGDLAGARALLDALLAGEAAEGARHVAASALNNRAQVARLAGDAAGAMADVDAAVAAAMAALAAAGARGGEETARLRKVLQQAYTQRSILWQ
jgi:hypothetical protein